MEKRNTLAMASCYALLKRGDECRSVEVSQLHPADNTEELGKYLQQHFQKWDCLLELQKQ